MNKERSLASLKAINNRIRTIDPELVVKSEDFGTELELEGAVFGDIDQEIAEESIVMRRLRPVLTIKNDETELSFEDQEEETLWKERLQKAKDKLDIAIRAVGRIDLMGAELEWIGTGWLVAENLVVTNRHVAEAFAHRTGARFDFKMGPRGKIGAALDFRQEAGSEEQLVFKLVRPVHIERRSGPDIALFEIDLTRGDAKLASPIGLARRAKATNAAAVIGYPAYDSRIPDTELMESIYGKLYNKKRLAPGAITRVDAGRLEHDCTTLGGNSGSVVVDLESGDAFGLHFSGRFMINNYAVPADVLSKVIDDVRNGRSRWEAPSGSARASPRLDRPVGAGKTIDLTIPLRITVSLCAPQAPIGEPPEDFGSSQSEGDDEPEWTEATAADYRDRRGYDASFLGESMALGLPTIQRDSHDVLPLTDGSGAELKYEHFSVVMSRSRRMGFFSAANIDGGQSRRSARVAWKWDPRIPRNQQIMGECYGSPPKFSRGHMTRREDPGWGDPQTARRGNEDSMHVTNVVPQMQAFNSPIWLALEDYALQHAREDEMRISVFTGPYFSRGDPTKYGIRIPLAFWKLIAFVHEETGRLCATGYEMTQRENLADEEFVFGPFRSPHQNVATQVPIRFIEAKSGLSFGALAALDPLAGEEEGFLAGGARQILERLEQIKFV
jgi:endonuclease G, mitochondrial